MPFNYEKCIWEKQKKIIGLREYTLTKYIIYFFTPPIMTPWWAALGLLDNMGLSCMENQKGSWRSERLYWTLESHGSPGMAPVFPCSVQWPSAPWPDAPTRDSESHQGSGGKWHFLPLPWLWLKVLAECFPFRLPCSHTFQEDWKTLNLSEDVPVSSCWELWTLRWVFPSSITQKQPKGREQLLLVRASPVAFCSYLFSFIFSGKRHISHTVNQFGLQCLLNWNFPITSTLWRKYSWKQETVRIILQLLCLKRWAVMGETVLLTLWSIPVVTAQATFPALGLERKPDSPCNRRTHPNLLQVCTCSATHWHTVTVPWHSNTL